MRFWVCALLLLVAGTALLWLGFGQLDAALTRSSETVSGVVARVEPAGAARGGRYTIGIKGQKGRFVLVSPILPHPEPQALSDARTVTIAHDDRARIMSLSVDGRVYFTEGDYALLIALSAFIPLAPGAAMFGFGAVLINRLRGKLSTKPARVRRPKFVEPEPIMAVVLPFRRPQRTADGEWLH